jgi:hypothetical protein
MVVRRLGECAAADLNSACMEVGLGDAWVTGRLGFCIGILISEWMMSATFDDRMLGGSLAARV